MIPGLYSSAHLRLYIVIAEILQEAFNWEPGKRKVAPHQSSLFEEETDSGPDVSKQLSDIEAQFKSVQVNTLKRAIPYY